MLPIPRSRLCAMFQQTLISQLSRDLTYHAKGLWNRKKESRKVGIVPSVATAGRKITGHVLVFSSAAIDNHGCCGDDDYRNARSCTQDPEAE